MKKIWGLIFIAAFIINTLVMIAPEACAADSQMKCKDSPFQKASDVMHGKYEVKAVPYKKITTFQKISDAIGMVKRVKRQNSEQALTK